MTTETTTTETETEITTTIMGMSTGPVTETRLDALASRVGEWCTGVSVAPAHAKAGIDRVIDGLRFGPLSEARMENIAKQVACVTTCKRGWCDSPQYCGPSKMCLDTTETETTTTPESTMMTTTPTTLIAPTTYGEICAMDRDTAEVHGLRRGIAGFRRKEDGELHRLIAVAYGIAVPSTVAVEPEAVESVEERLEVEVVEPVAEEIVEVEPAVEETPAVETVEPDTYTYTPDIHTLTRADLIRICQRHGVKHKARDDKRTLIQAVRVGVPAASAEIPTNIRRRAPGIRLPTALGRLAHAAALALTVDGGEEKVETVEATTPKKATRAPAKSRKLDPEVKAARATARAAKRQQEKDAKAVRRSQLATPLDEMD